MTEFVRSLLGGSRYIILLAVIGTFLSAVVLTIYGVVAVVSVSVHSFMELDPLALNHRDVERIALEFISLIDVFLLCTVLYIVALGLYELFIDPDLPLPKWLLIDDLDDLKEKLGSVVIVLLAVNFLGNFVQSNGEIGILWLGLGAASVIVAIAFAFAVRPRHAPAVAVHPIASALAPARPLPAAKSPLVTEPGADTGAEDGRPGQAEARPSQ